MMGVPLELRTHLFRHSFSAFYALLGEWRAEEEPFEHRCASSAPHNRGHNNDHLNAIACSEVGYFLPKNVVDCSLREQIYQQGL